MLLASKRALQSGMLSVSNVTIARHEYVQLAEDAARMTTMKRPET